MIKLFLVAVVLAALAMDSRAKDMSKRNKNAPLDAKDGEICDKTITIPAKPDGWVSDYVKCRTLRPDQIVTRVEATDLDSAKSGNAAVISLTNRNTNVYMWSNISEPLSFNVKVYATPI